MNGMMIWAIHFCMHLHSIPVGGLWCFLFASPNSAVTLSLCSQNHVVFCTVLCICETRLGRNCIDSSPIISGKLHKALGDHSGHFIMVYKAGHYYDWCWAEVPVKWCRWPEVWFWIGLAGPTAAVCDELRRQSAGQDFLYHHRGRHGQISRRGWGVCCQLCWRAS